jgi:TrmH family RNA methyltransferase
MTSQRIITSPQNQRVKDAAKLRDRRQRKQQARFLIDGAREIGRAIAAEIPLVEAFICDELCQSDEARGALAGLAQGGGVVWQVTPEVFEKLAFGDRHEGLVAVGRTVSRSLDQVEVPAASLVAVVAGLEKPGNVGAILRSADAAGLAAVIVADAGSDLYNPNCIRASLGTVFAKNVCEATSDATIAWLRARGAQIFTAQVDSDTLYTDVDYRGDAAIVLGSEAHGLGPQWQAATTTPIRLPMLGTADSLNVSATAAVLFYEAVRQRGNRAVH